METHRDCGAFGLAITAVGARRYARQYVIILRFRPLGNGLELCASRPCGYLVTAYRAGVSKTGNNRHDQRKLRRQC